MSSKTTATPTLLPSTPSTGGRDAGNDLVQQLKAVGIEARAFHWRQEKTCSCGCTRTLSNGGGTCVLLYNACRLILGTGVARCRDDERFNRKLGFRVALGRALKDMRTHYPEHQEIGGEG